MLEAKLRYLPQKFEIIEDGHYVKCSVTGQTIFLDELKYWCVARQEPYIDGMASLQRHLQLMDENKRNDIEAKEAIADFYKKYSIEDMKDITVITENDEI